MIPINGKFNAKLIIRGNRSRLEIPKSLEKELEEGIYQIIISVENYAEFLIKEKPLTRDCAKCGTMFFPKSIKNIHCSNCTRKRKSKK